MRVINGRVVGDTEYFEGELAKLRAQMSNPVATAPSVALGLVNNRPQYQYQPTQNFLPSPSFNSQPLASLLGNQLGGQGQFGAGRFLNNGNAMQGLMQGNPMQFNQPNASLMQQSIASKAVK